MAETAKSAEAGDVASHNWVIVMPGKAEEKEPDPCTKCHKDKDRTALQQIIDQRQAEISGLLEKLKEELDAAADKEADAYKTAFTNYTFVEADGSKGFHNYAYAKAILESSLNLLAAAPAAVAPTPAALPVTGGPLAGVLPVVAGGGLLLTLIGAGAALISRRRK